jgi:hypothetical protein
VEGFTYPSTVLFQYSSRPIFAEKLLDILLNLLDNLFFGRSGYVASINIDEGLTGARPTVRFTADFEFGIRCELC